MMRFEPSTASLVQVKPHEVQVGRPVGVGGNGDVDSQVLSHLTVKIGEVQAYRLGIQLQNAPPLEGGHHDLFHVDIIGRTLIEETASGMGQNIAMRIIHGLYDPFCLLAPWKVELRMDGADGEIQPCEDFVGEIQCTVF